ncbi:MAG: RNA polymerase sigma factor [Patescibacteria group bacterium]|nr:RNA polymerase sigma factor [Patescibacteria group bacterium]
MEHSDNRLIAECLAGDNRSFDLLIRKYMTMVYALAYRLTGSAVDAEDITQEVFVKAWKHLKSFDQKRNFKAWLLGITHHAAIDFFRKRKDFRFSDLAAGTDESGDTTNPENDIPDTELLPDRLAEQALARNLLESVLPDLDPRDREILLLRYTEELTFEDIGKVLKSPLNTVKSRHRRALIRLRGLLHQKGIA